MNVEVVLDDATNAVTAAQIPALEGATLLTVQTTLVMPVW